VSLLDGRISALLGVFPRVPVHKKSLKPHYRQDQGVKDYLFIELARLVSGKQKVTKGTCVNLEPLLALSKFLPTSF